MKNFQKTFKSFLFTNRWLLLVLACVLLVYSPSLKNDFVWDDYDFVLEWQTPKDLGRNWQLLLAGDLPENYRYNYRPLRSLWYGFSYLGWGTNPVFYHLQAVLIHTLSTLVVILLAQTLTGSKNSGLLAGLIFGLHPIQSEAVLFVTASFDTIGNLFFGLSLYLLIRFTYKQDHRLKIASLIMAMLAMYTNELTLTLPVVIWAYVFFYKNQKRSVWQRLKITLNQTKSFLALTLPYIYMRFFVLNQTWSVYTMYDSLTAQVTLMINSVAHYIKLFFLPTNIGVIQEVYPGIYSFFMHDFNVHSPPPEPTLTHPQTIQSLLLLISLALAIYLFWRATKQKRLVLFAASLLVIGILPVIQIIPTASLFSPRYFYLSMIAVSLLLSNVVEHLLASIKTKLTKRIIFSCLGFTLLFWSGLVIIRTYDWSTSETLWKKTISQVPESSLAYNNLGRYYWFNQNKQKALDFLEQAVRLNPSNTTHRLFLAQAYYQEKNYRKAIEHIDYMSQREPNNFQYHLLLAEAYESAGELDKSISHYQEVVRIIPGNMEVVLKLRQLEKYVTNDNK